MSNDAMFARCVLDGLVPSHNGSYRILKITNMDSV